MYIYNIYMYIYNIYIYIYIYIYNIYIYSYYLWKYLQNYFVKRNMRAKFTPCFYVMFFKHFWSKELMQSFQAFYSVFTKLRSFKFFHRRKWRHTHEQGKHFTPAFLCISWLILWRKNLMEYFMVFLTIYHEMLRYKSLK